MRLNNQTAIVTGGGQGIGQQISLRLAQEGANVIIADINREGSEETAKVISEKYGRKAQVIQTDVTNEGSVADMVRAVLQASDSIDILVNNSGIAGPVKAVEEIDLKEWEATMSVNLSGMFLCCKYVIPVFKKQSRGTIINIASVTGKRALPLRTPYAASKMGVIGFTRTLAAEVGKWKIRVNAVCPGAVTGDRQKVVFEGIMKHSGKSWDEVVAERSANSPLNTLIDPQYVAAVVSFLCTDDANMMTGQDINVSAGSLMY